MPLNQPYSQNGTLVVRAVTAGGALPVLGANITVYGADAQNAQVRYNVLSGESGESQPLLLPAPLAALSKTPGTFAPYATYDVVVQKDGYYLHKSFGVPVFADIVSVQTVELVPQSYSGGGGAGPNTFDGEKQITGPNGGGNGA